jgi:sucrose phosphorylase
VVQRLLTLIRFRNSHPAFAGEFSWEHRAPAVIALRWRHHDDVAELVTDFGEGTFDCVSTGGGASA